jgi:hypothetical protein
MKKIVFIISLMISFVILFAQCKKKEEIPPKDSGTENPGNGGGNNNGDNPGTVKPIVIAYTIGYSDPC